jgi:hypothetical protein
MKNNDCGDGWCRGLFYVPETKGGYSAFIKETQAEVYAKLIDSYVIYYSSHPDNCKFESLLGEASAISPFTAKDDI